MEAAGVDGTASDLALFDASGRRVLWQQLQRATTQVEVDLRSLANGTYHVLVTSAKGTYSTKVVVVH